MTKNTRKLGCHGQNSEMKHPKVEKFPSVKYNTTINNSIKYGISLIRYDDFIHDTIQVQLGHWRLDYFAFDGKLAHVLQTKNIPWLHSR